MKVPLISLEYNFNFIILLYFLIISIGCSKDDSDPLVGIWNYSDININGNYFVRMTINEDHIGTWRSFSCNDLRVLLDSSVAPLFSCLEAEITEKHVYDTTLEYTSDKIFSFDWRVEDDLLILFFNDTVSKFKIKDNLLVLEFTENTLYDESYIGSMVFRKE